MYIRAALLVRLFIFESMKQLEKGSAKLLNAWASYDWANSVYSLVIASAVFPIYYGQLFKEKGTQEIEVFGIVLKNTALISFITAFAFLVVAFLFHHYYPE